MLDFKKIEEEILKFWKDNNIYEKSKKKNLKGKKFYFLQGPPYTSGRLHIGHAWNNAMKDLAMRFFRLNGYNVWDRAGYDMHGLPTENKVQKELNLEDKKAIINYGLAKFSEKCMKFSTDNAKLMNEDLKRLGVWMDFDNAYLPVTNEFMSSEWLLMKKAFEQKRLYKGKKVMQWCSSCETSLAKHELEYENVTDKAIYVKFKLKNSKNEYFVIFTTTPWTIPFNLAIMANPDFSYVKAKVGSEIWILAKDLADHLIKDILGKKYELISEIKGKKLEGLEYIHPFEDIINYKELKNKNIHTIILSKPYVTLDLGTGLVHSAPGCGPEDYEACQEYKIEAFNTIDEKGIFVNSGKFDGKIAKKNDEDFIAALEEKGALLASEKVQHEYAHCWRCHEPIVFRTTEQWFLKTEDLVNKILEYNKKINWVPKIVQNSYEAWITNLKDNGITRQRFWGTPAPIWICENDKCGNIEVLGSQEELKKKAITKLPENLHKPWIDEVLLKCSKCNKNMKRVSDVIDVWIDSGTASWNCLYYPKREDYFKEFFPADLIIEASEQAHLWFSMLQICSTILFGKSCYSGVFGHGMILDYQGMKMSKSLGNIISPYEVIDKYSSEILRYYICETKAGENINFNWEDVKQKQRNLIVLMNTATYLSQLKANSKKQELELEEKYLFSRLNSTIKNATELFEKFRFDETITELEKFYLDISRIYIKMTRDKSSENPSLVFYALKEAYSKLLTMFSTICPLLTESLWQQLRKEKIVEEESVHLSSWPKYDDKKIDLELEKEFDVAFKIIEAGLFARDKAQIGLKWPLSKAIVSLNEKEKLSKEILEIIERQINVKKVEIKKSKENEVSVELDTKLTPELEGEGYAREISRKIQALRKTAGLVKENLIEAHVVVSVDILKLIEDYENFIKDRTNSKKIELSNEKPKKKVQFENSDKIKDKDVWVGLNKV